MRTLPKRLFGNIRGASRFGTIRDTAGFTILFAVLVGSLLFSIGLAIGHISIKEIVLSTAGKESEAAFFAADTGTECALYWDIVQRVFSSGLTENPDSVTCNGDTFQVSEELFSDSDGSGTVSSFDVEIPESAALRCASVSIYKYEDGDTKVESRGRNDCHIEQNPARVERALRVTY